MDKSFINKLYEHKWVVYAKQPFTGPQSVVEYLGRYTHKIAISNHRIKNHEAGKVIFSYKDYTQGGINKEMPLEALEFIRRFSLHVLPKGFVRIRHYGICSSSSKEKSAVIIKAQLPERLPPPPPLHRLRLRHIMQSNVPAAKKKRWKR